VRIDRLNTGTRRGGAAKDCRACQALAQDERGEVCAINRYIAMWPMVDGIAIALKT